MIFVSVEGCSMLVSWFLCHVVVVVEFVVCPRLMVFLGGFLVFRFCRRPSNGSLFL